MAAVDRPWRLRESDSALVREISRRHGVSELVARLLFHRGHRAGDAMADKATRPVIMRTLIMARLRVSGT